VSLTSLRNLLPLLSSTRFPTTPIGVVVDFMERGYLYGFALLQIFTSLYPAIAERSSTFANGDALTRLEFLPLMVTSIYCAIGVIWAFLKLSVLYLREMF